jgi:hypothetical protein
MGKNPFKTALLGAGVGAAGAGAGLFGAAGAGGATATGAAGTIGTTGEIGGSLLSTAGGLGGGSVALPAASSGALSGQSILAGKGTEFTGAGMLGSVNNAASITPSLLNSVGAGGVMTNAGAIPLTTMDKVGNYISNLPNEAMNYVKNNPLSSAKMAVDVATPAPPQQQPEAQIPPILRGNYDPSSSLTNVSPNINLTETNKNGLLGMMARIPMTDEERIRLQQLVYRG